MNAAQWEWFDRYQEAVACKYCGALPGAPCHLPSGKVRNPHTARWYEMRPFYRDRACPIHSIPDCSPLLNGCSLLSSAPEGSWTTR